jgi:hypothetical protein
MNILQVFKVKVVDTPIVDTRLVLIEHPQVQRAPPRIGCLKVHLNCHWLLLKPCVGIEYMFCLTWVH